MKKTIFFKEKISSLDEFLIKHKEGDIFCMKYIDFQSLDTSSFSYKDFKDKFFFDISFDSSKNNKYKFALNRLYAPTLHLCLEDIEDEINFSNKKMKTTSLIFFTLKKIDI